MKFRYDRVQKKRGAALAADLVDSDFAKKEIIRIVYYMISPVVTCKYDGL